VVQSVLDLLVNMMAPDTLRDHIDNLRIGGLETPEQMARH